jgi:hypothetical protein
MRRSAPVLLAVGLTGVMVAGCARTAAPPPETMIPLVPPADLPVSTPAPTTTQAPSSDPNDPIIGTVPDLECAFGAQLVGGEITFVVGDRVIGTSLDGEQVRCLTTLRPEQRGPISWSPRTDRALLNTAYVLDTEGIRQTGFDASNTRVRWELPAGTALFAPTSSGRTLVRRDAADATRSEITFLERTTAATWIPAGTGILAAGEDDGVSGIWLDRVVTDGDPQALVTLADDDTEIAEIAVDGGGDAVYLITVDDVSVDVLRVSLTELTVVELFSEQAPSLQLTTGPVAGALAWKVGLCNSVTTTRVRDQRSGAIVQVGVGTPLDGLSVGPVGWVDANRLVVIARPLGCDGPGDVWIWNLLDGSATLLVKFVEFPATRIVPEVPRAPIIPATAPPTVL